MTEDMTKTETIEINHAPNFDVDKVIEHYKEKDGVDIRYVCTSDLKASDVPCDIFFRDTPHPEFGNRYFGVYQNPIDDRMYITNADSVEDLEFTCAQMEDGQMAYSRHRHDLVEVDGGAIDGGRSYTRVIGDVGVLNARVKDGKMVAL